MRTKVMPLNAFKRDASNLQTAIVEKYEFVDKEII